MTLIDNVKCECGGSFRLLDQGGNSYTIQCGECNHCSLLISRSNRLHVIRLADFHLKRGANGYRSMADLTMAENLVRCLLDDEMPTPAITVDFGISSSCHLGALQNAVRLGVTAYELDRVMGDGPAITQLVNSVPAQPYGLLEFETEWDDLLAGL